MIVKCGRCYRRYRGKGDWNCTAVRGRIVGYLCPDCQTPEENAEALVKEATLKYHRDRSSGLFYATPKDRAS